MRSSPARTLTADGSRAPTIPATDAPTAPAPTMRRLLISVCMVRSPAPSRATESFRRRTNALSTRVGGDIYYVDIEEVYGVISKRGFTIFALAGSVLLAAAVLMLAGCSSMGGAI